MIVVQSPLRVSLFGGGTDFPSYYLREGGCVLSTTIDKRIFVMAKRRFDRLLRVGYTRTELVENLDDIQHELIREALRVTGIQEAIEISTMADIPSAGSGLGSSSTVTVGALLALHSLAGQEITPERLAGEACQIEIDVLGKPIGVQDQHAAAFGGLRFMEFRPGGEISVEAVAADPAAVEELEDNLLLFYTGITRKAESVLEQQKANIGDRLSVLAEMKSLAYAARDRLLRGEINAIGELLHHSWTLKRQLASGISNGEIEEIYEIARRHGAIGGKITGAGGGGFILLYCPKQRQGELRAALGKLQELPFRFEPEGAKVILDQRPERNSTVPDDQSGTPGASSIGEVPLTPADRDPILTYLSELKVSLDRLKAHEIEAVIDLLHRMRLEGRKVFIMGNGGSASTASHFACDLGKNTRMPGWPDFRVLALTDNMATFSALANDDGYDRVFVGQIASLLEPGDVAIAISTSGNSPNVLRAIELAGLKGAHTVGFTGFDGGRLKGIVDLNVHVPNDCIERVEDIHLMLEHLICTALREKAQSRVEEADSLPVRKLDGGRLRLLYEMNRELAERNGSDGVFQHALSLAVTKMGASSGSVVVLDNDGQVIGGSVAYAGQVRERRPRMFVDVYRSGLAGWAAQERQAALVPDTRQDLRWFRKPWEENGWSKRSAIAAPILSNGDVRAVITLVRSGAIFGEGDLALLKALVLCVSLVDGIADGYPSVEQGALSANQAEQS